MKGTDHTGNVFNRRPFDAPLTHGPGKIAVKVADDEITAGVKHIAKMVITVVTSAHSGDACVTQGSETIAQSVAARKQFPGFILRGAGKLVHMLAQCVH